MGKIKYTEEQIIELKRNKYVKNVTNKHIIFTKECKIEAVKLSEKYTIPKEIFRTLGFPEYVIHSDTPSNSVIRWKRNIQIKGTIEEGKGQKKRELFDISKMNKDEYIEYLEAKLALAEELKRIDSGNYP